MLPADDEEYVDIRKPEYDDTIGVTGQRYLQLPKHGVVVVHSESVPLSTVVHGLLLSVAVDFTLDGVKRFYAGDLLGRQGLDPDAWYMDQSMGWKLVMSRNQAW